MPSFIDIILRCKQLVVGISDSQYSKILWYPTSPEGNVAAPPGSICMTGTGSAYQKDSGSGATGWVAIGSGAGGGNKFVGIVIDGGGSVITTGTKGYVSIPINGTLVAWRILSIDPAVTSGSIVIDVWKDTFANYPPTNADSITNGHEPTVSGATKAEDSDLSDWTTQSVTEGDVLGFNVDSVTSFTRVTLVLEIQP